MTTEEIEKANDAFRHIVNYMSEINITVGQYHLILSKLQLELILEIVKTGIKHGGLLYDNKASKERTTGSKVD